MRAFKPRELQRLFTSTKTVGWSSCACKAQEAANGQEPLALLQYTRVVANQIGPLGDQGAAGVSPCFHLPGCHVGYQSLTHSHCMIDHDLHRASTFAGLPGLCAIACGPCFSMHAAFRMGNRQNNDMPATSWQQLSGILLMISIPF